VRENSAKLLSQSDYTFAESVNLAVNQTLIRSLNTSVTSLLPVVSILFIGTYFLGAGTLRDLALVMFVGMILSTLSSMFIASPIAVQLAHLDPKIRQHTEKVEKARGELRERIAERRAAGEEISSEEEEDMVVHAGHVIRTPGRHLGTAAQPHRKNRKKK
jgi:protein-export membrane protein secF